MTRGTTTMRPAPSTPVAVVQRPPLSRAAARRMTRLAEEIPMCHLRTAQEAALQPVTRKGHAKRLGALPQPCEASQGSKRRCVRGLWIPAARLGNAWRFLGPRYARPRAVMATMRHADTNGAGRHPRDVSRPGSADAR